MVIPIPTRRA